MQKRSKQFRGTDLILFSWYNNYLERNVPEDSSKEMTTLTPLRITTLAILHYGVYLQSFILLGAGFMAGLEKLLY